MITMVKRLTIEKPGKKLKQISPPLISPVKNKNTNNHALTGWSGWNIIKSEN